MECYIVVKNYIYRELLKAHLCSKKSHHASKRVTETLLNPEEFLDILISFLTFFFFFWNQRRWHAMVLKQEKLVGEDYNPCVNLYPHKKQTLLSWEERKYGQVRVLNVFLLILPFQTISWAAARQLFQPPAIGREERNEKQCIKTPQRLLHHPDCR